MCCLQLCLLAASLCQLQVCPRLHPTWVQVCVPRNNFSPYYYRLGLRIRMFTQNATKALRPFLLQELRQQTTSKTGTPFQSIPISTHRMM